MPWKREQPLLLLWTYCWGAASSCPGTAHSLLMFSLSHCGVRPPGIQRSEGALTKNSLLVLH